VLTYPELYPAPPSPNFDEEESSHSDNSSQISDDDSLEGFYLNNNLSPSSYYNQPDQEIAEASYDDDALLDADPFMNEDINSINSNNSITSHSVWSSYNSISSEADYYDECINNHDLNLNILTSTYNLNEQSTSASSTPYSSTSSHSFQYITSTTFHDHLQQDPHQLIILEDGFLNQLFESLPNFENFSSHKDDIRSTPSISTSIILPHSYFQFHQFDSQVLYDLNSQHIMQTYFISQHLPQLIILIVLVKFILHKATLRQHYFKFLTQVQLSRIPILPSVLLNSLLRVIPNHDAQRISQRNFHQEPLLSIIGVSPLPVRMDLITKYPP
jgi:hypothetical protein